MVLEASVIVHETVQLLETFVLLFCLRKKSILICHRSFSEHILNFVQLFVC